MDRIKVPVGALRRANDLGIRALVLFYYNIKSINNDGFFKKGGIIEEMTQHTGLSKASILRNIKGLIKIGLVHKHPNGYRLVKYNRLFKLLGYKMSPIRNRWGGTKRLGRFHINKIPLVLIQKIGMDSAVSYYEMKYSFREQKRAIQAKKSYVARLDEKNRGMLIPYKVYKEEVSSVCINENISLSCQTIANMIGRESKSTGYKIERNLIKHNLIKVRNDWKIIAINPLTKVDMKSNYLIKEGIIWELNVNKIEILKYHEANQHSSPPRHFLRKVR